MYFTIKEYSMSVYPIYSIIDCIKLYHIIESELTGSNSDPFLGESPLILLDYEEKILKPLKSVSAEKPVEPEVCTNILKAWLKLQQNYGLFNRIMGDGMKKSNLYTFIFKTPFKDVPLYITDFKIFAKWRLIIRK